MAKKIKLDIDFNEDNSLIGISCHKRDYWFAYHMNERLKLNLRRLKDFPFFHVKLKETLKYSLFHCTDPEEQFVYYMIANHNQQSPLFPELRTTDFFILVQGKLTDSNKSELLSRIRSVNGVLTAFFPDTNKIREYDNFLTDLELHMTTAHIRD